MFAVCWKVTDKKPQVQVAYAGISPIPFPLHPVPHPPLYSVFFFLSANQENRESANYCQVASFQKRLSNICFYIKLTSMFLHIDQPHSQSEKKSDDLWASSRLFYWYRILTKILDDVLVLWKHQISSPELWIMSEKSSFWSTVMSYTPNTSGFAGTPLLKSPCKWLCLTCSKLLVGGNESKLHANDTRQLSEQTSGEWYS